VFRRCFSPRRDFPSNNNLQRHDLCSTKQRGSKFVVERWNGASIVAFLNQRSVFRIPLTTSSPGNTPVRTSWKTWLCVACDATERRGRTSRELIQIQAKLSSCFTRDRITGPTISDGPAQASSD